jgi:hypothetical protein
MLKTEKSCLVFCTLLCACSPNEGGLPPVTSHEASLSAATPITFVSLAFDDGRASQLRVAADLADPVRGPVPATFFVNSDRLGSDGYQQWSDLVRLASDGHEIAGHDLAHSRLVDRDFADDQRLACDDRAQLVAGGHPVADFAFPFGANDSVAEAAVASCLDAARDIGGIRVPDGQCTSCPYAETLPPRDLYAIRSVQSFSNCPSAAFMQGFVDRAIGVGGGWLSLVFHQVALDDTECGEYAVRRDDFVQLLDYLRAQAAAGTVRLVRQHDVIGFTNPSFERPGAVAGSSDCWERVTYIDGPGSFARAAVGHSGAAAESIVNGAVASRKLLADRRRPECLPVGLVGHSYRMSAWYQYASGDGSPASVRFIVYYRDAATGKWLYLKESPSVSSSAGWARMVWDTPRLPAGAAAITAGVAMTSVGQLTIDDLMMSDLGPTAE